MLNCSTSTLTRLFKDLEDNNFISRSIIYKEDSKHIEERRIYLNTGIVTGEHRPIVTDEHRPIVTDEQDNNTSNNNINNNNIDDVYGKMFFKLVDIYPQNRIGNRQHNLKKFKGLSIDECKLSLKNLNRYLELTNGYHKSLSNYIVEKCFTEEWLQAQLETNKSKQNKNNKNNASSFENRNSGFYD